LTELECAVGKGRVFPNLGFVYQTKHIAERRPAGHGTANSLGGPWKKRLMAGGRRSEISYLSWTIDDVLVAE
jgi:hypothetical protein